MVLTGTVWYSIYSYQWSRLVLSGTVYTATSGPDWYCLVQYIQLPVVLTGPTTGHGLPATLVTLLHEHVTMELSQLVPVGERESLLHLSLHTSTITLSLLTLLSLFTLHQSFTSTFSLTPHSSLLTPSLLTYSTPHLLHSSLLTSHILTL